MALQASLNSDLKGHSLEVAIDFHDQSYYGKVEQAEGLWGGAEAKNGRAKRSEGASGFSMNPE